MRLPFTLRLISASVKAAVAGTVLFLMIWIGLMPATQQEREALTAPQFAPYPPGLRQMRAAQVVLVLAPDRIYKIAGAASDPEVPAFMVKLIVQQAAAGNVAVAPSASPQTGDDTGGARFITVD